MFESVLIANRGEIACRIIRTCRSMGIRTVAVFSDADSNAAHVRQADEANYIGASPPAESYLNRERILQAAKVSSVDALHPGYGFLSEDPEFAEQVHASGVTWVGPAPSTIALMGDKVNARNFVQSLGFPTLPGAQDPIGSLDEALEAAARVGYPVMMKATAGGGGIGMSIADGERELAALFDSAVSRSERSFGSGLMLVERYLYDARHVEVQIVGFNDGTVIALGERDCSVQRRHQKVIEESPSPAVSDDLRARMLKAAVEVAGAVDYRGVGTVECLVEPSSQEFYFLEMNTRLQVEHPVTELVTDTDLVRLQLEIASGDTPQMPLQSPTGHAIECRVYAEDSVRFIPSPGEITHWNLGGDGARVDAGYETGDVVSQFYDPMLAKLCVHAATRQDALTKLEALLADAQIEGPRTNLDFLRRAVAHPDFVSGNYSTRFVEQIQV